MNLRSALSILPLALLSGYGCSEDDTEKKPETTQEITATEREKETPANLAEETPLINLSVRFTEPLVGETVCFSLFDEQNQEAFADPAAPPETAEIARCEVIDSDAAEITISDLPPGRYALAFFVDADKSGNLNAIQFVDEDTDETYSIPLEKIGFSNNARITPPPQLHIPSFAECAFEATTSPISMEISFFDPLS